MEGGYNQGQDNIALMQQGVTKKDRGMILITSFWRERSDTRSIAATFKVLQQDIRRHNQHLRDVH